MNSPKRFYGWPLLGIFMCVFVATLAFPFFGASVVNAAMAKELGLERSLLGLAFTLMVLCSGLPGPLVALVMLKVGARLTVVFGALIIALGSVLIATLVSTGWHFVLLFGVVGVGVSFSAAIPAQTTITQWFSRKRAFALSILWLSVGAGGSIAAPLLGKIIATTGNWRSGWWLIAALALVAAALAFFFVKNTPAEIGQAPDGDVLGAAPAAAGARRIFQTSEAWTLRQALRTRAFWIITACAIIYSLPLTVMFAHMIVHLKDLGHTASVAAMGLGLIGLSQVVGKLTVGFLGDRIEPRYLWGIAMMLMAVGLVVAIDARTANDIYLFAFLLGSGMGASLVSLPAMIGNYFGPKTFAGLMGAQTPIITIAVSSAPLLVGVVYDRLGSYEPSFIALSGMLVAGGFMILFARPPSVAATLPAWKAVTRRG
jgi:MFS family permease